MQETKYITFSLRTHKKNWRIKKPNFCQFELTFGCELHCKHCYSDCYNKPIYLEKELNIQSIKIILDKVYRAGITWICFTGGDPLTRKDFLDIYSFAKNMGFITTIFTNAYSMTKEIARFLKNKPPFLIELTLNAVTKDTYERISQVKDSFEKVMEGINLILKFKLPLRIKTQITKDNLKELPKIKKFIQSLGLRFRPFYDLHARLNGDLTPCNLRIPPVEILGLNGKKHLSDNKCSLSPSAICHPPSANLFCCAIGGGDGIQIDPYGNIFACNLIRKPSFNLLKVDIDYARNKLLSLVRERKFITNSKCNGCHLREICHWCPGRAYVEKANMEKPIDYYCELTNLLAG